MTTNLIQQYQDDGYTVVTYDEAYKQASDNIECTLWAFNPRFLSRKTGLNQVVFDKLAELHEDSNGAIAQLIELTCGLDDFIEQAIICDGAGYFLNTRNGEAIEFNQDGEYYVAFI